jgi:hypothetical protein
MMQPCELLFNSKVRTRSAHEVAEMQQILREARSCYYRFNASTNGSVCVRFRQSPHWCARNFQRAR